jgi:hypothetical protein
MLFMALEIIGKSLLVFILACLVDVLWVRYTLAVVTNDKLKAVLSSGILGMVSATNVLFYVTDPIYIIPNVLGLMVGTYAAMKFNKEL